ncbi:MAG: hypothetical protein H7338_13765 [Candidatus Sericytochromatia bacterium]|nr:hypothetical protein [Candidatus Sericytochromatia bacterium]
MGRVIHFEINAGDPTRLAGFYEQVSGWTVQAGSGPHPFWLINDCPGIDGSMLLRLPWNSL